MARILIADNITKKQCSIVFERLIIPELPEDIQVDYTYGWSDGLDCFKKNKYDIVVIESLLALRDFDFSQPLFKNVFTKLRAFFKKSGTVKGTVSIPGFSGEKVSNLLIYAYECIHQMQEINPETKYIVCCHVTSGYSKDEREQLEELDNVLGVLNFLSSKRNQQAIVKLIKKYLDAGSSPA